MRGNRDGMQTINKDMIYGAVRDAIPRLACELPDDVACALKASREDEQAPYARCALDQLVANEQIARIDRVPICQDTGTVWVCLEVGSGIEVTSDALSRVDEAVADEHRVGARGALGPHELGMGVDSGDKSGGSKCPLK